MKVLLFLLCHLVAQDSQVVLLDQIAQLYLVAPKQTVLLDNLSISMSHISSITSINSRSARQSRWSHVSRNTIYTRKPRHSHFTSVSF